MNLKRFSALTLAVSGHALLGWSLAAAPQPILLEPQQMITVSLVRPGAIAPVQEKAVEKPVEQATLQAPIAETGMVKAQELPVKEQEEPEKKVEEEKPAEAASAPSVTGMTARDATREEDSAFQEPLFEVASLNNPSPQYPRSARRSGIEGKVMVEVEVSKNGMPKTVRVSQSSGYSMLDIAALKAIESWRFVPARRGFQTVDASVLVPVEFKITR